MDITQIPPGSVVVGVDGSEGAERAERWGADVAQRERRPLVLLHGALPPPTFWAEAYAAAYIDEEAARTAAEREAEELVAAAAGRVAQTHPALAVTTLTSDRDPRVVLLEAAQRAHLLVLGSRGRGPVRSLFLGSVSASVSRGAECPVAVVRPPGTVPTTSVVVVAVEGSEHDRAVVDAAFQHATHTGSLLVLHCEFDPWTVDESTRSMSEADPAYEEASALVAESVAGVAEKYPDVEVEVRIALGDPATAVVAASSGAALLVVGRRRREGVARLLHHAFATTVVERAECTVLVVPS